MRRLAAILLGIITCTALTVASASASGGPPPPPCGLHCKRILSGQPLPLEIGPSGPLNMVKAGTPLIGVTPQFGRRVRFHVNPPFLGSSDRVFRWDSTHLCITASSDVLRSQLTLQHCNIGSAGSSHQIWTPLNIIDHGFRVYRNEANGLVMTLAGDFNGAQLQIRHKFFGVCGCKNFTLIPAAGI